MGDEFLILGDFENKSTQSGLWNTTGALLGFVGNPGATHNYLLSGDAPLFGWGGLYLANGNYLVIPGYFANGLYFGKIYLENISQLRDITSNSDIYYNALLDLNGQPLDPTGYQINGQGRLKPVLQPTTFNLFLPLILSQ